MGAATRAEARKSLQVLAQALPEAERIETEEQKEKQKERQADQASDRNRDQSSQQHRPRTTIVPIIGQSAQIHVHINFAFRLPLSQVAISSHR
jgi:hypothetical protein